MATTGKNTVSLVVEAGVTGEDQIRRLADDIRRLGREGGNAAPEFQALAAQLDRLGDQAGAVSNIRDLATQVDALGLAQREAAVNAEQLGNRYAEVKAKATPLREEQARLGEALREAQLEVVKAKGALDTYAAGFTKAQKDTAEFTQRQAQLKQALADSRVAVTQQEQALDRLTPALKAVAAEESKLQRQYEAGQARVTEANDVLRRRNTLLQEAQAVALAAGVSVTDLAAAEQSILGAVQATAAATQRLTTEREQAAAAAKELAALDAQAEAVQQRLQQQLIETAQAYERDTAAAVAATAAARAARIADYEAVEAKAAKAAAIKLAAEAAAAEAAASKQAAIDLKRVSDEADKAAADFRELEIAMRQAAEAEDRMAAAEGAIAMRRLEEAARQADAEMRDLAQSVRAAEAAEQEFTAATDRAAAASRDDAEVLRQRVAAAERLVTSERELSVAQRELLNQRNAGRAALVAEAQALLQVAAASREAQATILSTATAARQAGDALRQAFGTVGIRSIDAIEAEIEQTSAALTRLETASRRGALGQDELARAAGAAEVKIARLRAEILQVQTTPGNFERLSAGINDIITRFAGLGAAVATVGVAVRPVIEATVALDQMRRVLTTVTGSSELAEQQIALLRRTATQAGVSFSAVGESYSKFAASALQSGLSIAEVNKVFNSVALAAGNLGLNSDQAKRALEALSQIASKGTVSMEELRQQLGDALPGVLPLLARELGLTQRELVKLVESGGLLASEAIPAIGRSLDSLGPASGKVEGLVASWNRFINVVKEAGTVLVDGPLGQTAGVVVAAFAGALRDVAVVAVSASEAFKLFGLTVLATVDALTPGGEKLEDLGGKLDGFAQQAGARIAAFKETAYGADQSLQGLGKTAGFTGESFAKLTIEQQKLIEAATLGAQSAEKNVQAKKSEAEEIVRLAGLLGDETAARLAGVDAARLVLRATEEQLRADEALLASYENQKRLTLEQVELGKMTADGVKALVEELDKKIVKAGDDAEKTRAQASAARALATAQDLAAQSAGDQSARLEELRENVVAATAAQVLAARRYAEGKGSLDDLKRSTDALKLAKGLLRDAIDDLDKALKTQIATVKSDIEVKRASLELDLAQAKNLRAIAIERGNETEARQLGIRIAEVEQALRRTAISGTLQEAEATLRYVAAKEQELRAIGALTPEKQQELDLLRQSALATTLRTQAQVEDNKASDRQLESLRLGTEARDGHTGAVDRSTSSLGKNTGGLDTNTRSVEGNAKAVEGSAGAYSKAATEADKYFRTVSRGTAGQGASTGLEGSGITLVPGSDGNPVFAGRDTSSLGGRGSGAPAGSGVRDVRTGQIVPGDIQFTSGGGVAGSGLSGIGSSAPSTREQSMVRDEAGFTAKERDFLSKQGGPVDASYNFQTEARLRAGGSFAASEIPALENALRVSRDNGLLGARSIVPDLSGQADDRKWVAIFTAALDKARAEAVREASAGPLPTNDPEGFNGMAGYSPFNSAYRPGGALYKPPAPAPAPGVVMNVTIGGKEYTLRADSQVAADTTIRMLEEAYRAGGGGP